MKKNKTKMKQNYINEWQKYEWMMRKGKKKDTNINTQTNKKLDRKYNTDSSKKQDSDEERPTLRK